MESNNKSVTSTSVTDFYSPGKGGGLLDIFRNRYLLNLLVRKELRVRYRGSALGMLWSYVKPAVQFLVFYFAIGVFMGMNKAVPNFAVYLFSGVVANNFFSETFGNCTRSIVSNSALVKKIYLPRELFCVSSLWVAAVHFFPQVAILLIGALLMGWRPSLLNLASGVGGFAILVVFSLGLGLLFGAVNVLMRDAENFVDLINMIVTWASPILYHWDFVVNAIGDGKLWFIYNLNPITPVVEMFHYCFWAPTSGVDYQFPPGASTFVLLACVIALATLVIGEITFRRLDGRFAQEL